MNETLGSLVDRLRTESQNIRQNRPGPFELKGVADRLDSIADDLLAEAKAEPDAAPVSNAPEGAESPATNPNPEVQS